MPNDSIVEELLHIHDNEKSQMQQNSNPVRIESELMQVSSIDYKKLIGPKPVQNPLQNDYGKNNLADIEKQSNVKYPNILIIDDEQMNIEVLKILLKDRGYNCESYVRPLEGIGAVKNRFNLTVQGIAPMYKIIFLDFSMPDIDGPQVARMIREYFKENYRFKVNEPKIFCVTAFQEATFMRQAFLSGMDKFLTKPITQQDMDECLKDIQ